jgi:hypothetical protein
MFNLFVKPLFNVWIRIRIIFRLLRKRGFDEEMSGHFLWNLFAALRDEEGTIKIATLVTGSPASNPDRSM